MGQVRRRPPIWSYLTKKCWLMSNKEVRSFTEKLETGLRLAEKRMLEEKALHDETIVVAKGEGEFQYIPAKEVLATF